VVSAAHASLRKFCMAARPTGSVIAVQIGLRTVVAKEHTIIPAVARHEVH
jgi:hypothetical protein